MTTWLSRDVQPWKKNLITPGCFIYLENSRIELTSTTNTVTKILFYVKKIKQVLTFICIFVYILLTHVDNYRNEKFHTIFWKYQFDYYLNNYFSFHKIIFLYFGIFWQNYSNFHDYQHLCSKLRKFTYSVEFHQK